MRYVCTTLCVCVRERWESMTQWETSERIKLPCSSFPSLRKTWDWPTNASDYRRDKDSSSVHGDVFLSFGVFAVGKNRVLNMLRAAWRRPGQCFSGKDSRSTNLHVSLLGGGRWVWTTKVEWCRTLQPRLPLTGIRFYFVLDPFTLFTVKFYII